MNDDGGHCPRATYRMQLHANFGFNAAADLADYLQQLGISHLYASPYLQAAEGSTHGYDVLDHSRVNIELGGIAAHARLCETLGRHQLGQVLDIVPNHMSIAGRGNRWWWDVLENGPASRYADYFDVDWEPPEAKLRNTVLMPILGDHYGRVLEAGEVHIQREGGAFTVHYHQHVLPVAPRSLDGLLSMAAERAESDDLAFIADAYARLPLSTQTDRFSVYRRHRDKEVLRAQVERLCRERPQLAAVIDEALAEINASPDELDVLLDSQNYRLAFWRTASHELDYRRFFDINTLISLRIEDDRVFHDTHALILDWLRQGVLDGVRIDHPDGLRDPEQYFQRLREAAPQAWIVVEKILESNEELPATWPVAGTTGYDFLNRVLGVLIDPAGEGPLTEFYHDFTGEPTDYHAVVHDKKHLVMRGLFASDMNRLAALFSQVCERHRRYRDYTRRELNSVLREVIACLDVYRTYIHAEEGQVSQVDAERVSAAIAKARGNRPDLDADLFGFLEDLLLLRIRGDRESELVMRFQQHTGPVMAKGVEDTTFYCFNRLTALNEVGGDPGRFGLALEAFHQQMAQTQQRWPRTMLATTTHDTKRSEDVRARLAVLSEMAEPWQQAVRRWSAINQRHRVDGLPDRNAEYLLYQTLVGAWPIDLERISGYMTKAAREAKTHTSWTDPNEAYEQALGAFMSAVLADAQFLRDLEAFVAQINPFGQLNALAQKLIKLTAPGVPDIYQGTELWTYTLVDPDNRRAVDYPLRRRLLQQLNGLSPEEIMRRRDEGLPKLWLVRQALHYRRRRPDLFGPASSYTPCYAQGAKAAHVVAFRRGGDCLVVAPRLPVGLGGSWEDTALELPEGRWHNQLSGEDWTGTVPLERLLHRFPLALLTRD